MRLRGLALALAGCTLAVTAESAFAAAPALYSDAGRDAPASAPEITTVVVSNDDAGPIRFRINVANQARLARDATLELYLDTDQNPTTGDPLALGADYVFVVDGASQRFGFGRWDGTRFDFTMPVISAQVWYWSGVSISIHRTELGSPTALSFWVRAAGPASAADAAPDRGTWSYQLGTGGVNPADVSEIHVSFRPAVARAGATWQLRVDWIGLVGSTARVRPDRWSCTAMLAGRSLRGRGAGGCTFQLPRSARGKTVTVTVTVSYMGEVVSGTGTYVVR